MPTFPRHEIYLSLIIFLASTIGAVITFVGITASKQHNSVIVNDLALGSKHFAIFNDTGCVGRYLSIFKQSENTFEYSSSGDFNFKLNGSQALATFTLEAQFNSLGQLGASILRLTLAEASISIGTYDINPIKVKLSIVAPARSFQRGFTIPGPVQLKRADKEHYRIESANFSTVSARLASATEQPWLHQFLPHVSEIEDDDSRCSAYSAYIDLDDLNSKLRLFVGGIESYIPEWLKEQEDK